ncbi:MAG: deoxyribodipyrimidine photo-lyase [Oceanospirillales bacterium]|nr:MAG: deoxyribodipyrimidine photo-lyase [Oceanospirillales bacterium]
MKLVWLRNDLRVLDNPALYSACDAQQGVTVFVTLCPQQWELHDDAPLRWALWRNQLYQLKHQLSSLNIGLRVLTMHTYLEVPDSIAKLATELNVTELHFNYEYPLNERQRDRSVCQQLEHQGVTCIGHHGELIIPPGQVVTGQGGMFKVFTPFSRAWRQVYLNKLPEPLGMPLAQPAAIDSDVLPKELNWSLLTSTNEQVLNLWPVGEEAVHQRLVDFVDQQESTYKQQRDFPAINGTSKLSPYLAIGALSPLQCLQALKVNQAGDDWLGSTWLNEIIWREFYRHLLVAWPNMSRLEPFRPEVESRITWRNNAEGFDAWCRGETGFPIVDAAMKQLLNTGWMHNRLRMVVASFLTKLLGVDWRLGAAFFMRHLIDGDFASNMGGWQWAASVGADAAPYFRIFNPQLQSEKFDPDGVFIATWLPELTAVPAKKRHLPGAGQEYGRPAPIIDYKAARKAALDDYQQHG